MEVNSGFMLWLGLWSLVPMPTYEIEHFYTYDRDRKQQALPLQKKVFVPFSKDVDLGNYLGKYFDNAKITKLTHPHTPGWVIETTKNNEAVTAMDRLAQSKIMYYPVVKWDGMDCFPTQSFVVKTKPFVTEKLLRERLSKLLKNNEETKVVSIVRTTEDWEITLQSFYTFPNMLVLANMIAEDSWFHWARVNFAPLYAPMSGQMSVTNPAVLNLGYDKQLEVVISVYKPSVKIRKDLLPQLGQRFFPVPLKDSVWYDIGPTAITEEKYPDKHVIRMVTQFRYLNHGTVGFPSVEIAYEEGKQQGVFTIDGTQYGVQSVIKETAINDIQVRPSFPPIVKLADPGEFVRVVLPWQKLGLIVCVFGGVVLVFVGFVMTVKKVGIVLEGHRLVLAKRRLWYDLANCVNALTKDNWHDSYKEVSLRLSMILSVYFGIKKPIGSEQTDDADLCKILNELEKLYAKDAKPNIEVLKRATESFVNNHSKREPVNA